MSLAAVEDGAMLEPSRLRAPSYTNGAIGRGERSQRSQNGGGGGGGYAMHAMAAGATREPWEMQLEYEMREQASRAASSSREGSVTGGSSISGDYTDEELSLMQYAQIADGWDAARPGSGQGTGLEAARFLRYSCGELDPEYDGSEPSSGSSPRTPPLSQMTSKQRAAYEAAVSGNFYTRTFALGPKTFLKETTPMSVMSKFCSEHGIVNLFDLGQTADTQRWGLYNLLKLARWPEDVEELTESPPQPGILSRILMKKKLAQARSGMGSHGHQPNTSWLQVDLPPQLCRRRPNRQNAHTSRRARRGPRALPRRPRRQRLRRRRVGRRRLWRPLQRSLRGRAHAGQPQRRRRKGRRCLRRRWALARRSRS